MSEAAIDAGVLERQGSPTA